MLSDNTEKRQESESIEEGAKDVLGEGCCTDIEILENQSG
jgi:hypothetical protein